MRHILAVSILGILVTTTACPNGPSPVGPALNAVVDCLGENRPQINKLVQEFKGPILGGGSISWPDVKLRATQAGKDIGGCFIMELTQWFLSGTRATADAQLAHSTAEDFRQTVGGGATYATICVREDGTQAACKL